MAGDIEDIETAEEWEARARAKLVAAKHLRQVKQMEEAYHMAGVAVECALKALVMRHERLNRWPGRDTRPDLYVHDLSGLLAKAGLENAMDQQALAVTTVASAWLVVKDWTIGSRYAAKVKVRLARDMVEAAEELIKWML